MLRNNVHLADGGTVHLLWGIRISSRIDTQMLLTGHSPLMLCKALD